eukprot:gene10880-14602_t
MASKFVHLKEIVSGFYNLRGSFTFAFGFVDIGTHMSFIRLSSGKFLVLDTISIPPSGSIKTEIDTLTENGTLIEAVIACHPFHTMYFTPFNELYPGVKMYGTPRHIRNNQIIKWSGDVNDESTRKLWENEGVFMRIPDGAEFVNPEEDNHFSSLVVFHAPTRTIHVDDTFMYFGNPSFLFRLAGVRPDTMKFHLKLTTNGLLPTPEAPLQFQAWVQSLIDDWDFDNMCCAHDSNKIGGAKEKLIETLQSGSKVLLKMAEDRKNA